MMIFTQMQTSTLDLMNSIHQHAFNIELSAGTLPKEKFVNYLVQDSLYLIDFAKALALTGAKFSSLDLEFSSKLMQFSMDALKCERDVHSHYLSQHTELAKSFLQKGQNPACFMYTHYLLKTAAMANLEEAVASLLPCFWVYREVGKVIANCQNNHNGNPYAEWITLYSGEAFNDAVESMIHIVNTLGNAASSSMKEKMLITFRRATQMEWMFWDNAYRLEDWPITF